MKKILFPILALILIACTSPQVTVTSEVTVTLTPPPIEIPTATLNPEFNLLQQQIAKSENFTLIATGEIEMQTLDGVVIIPGVKVSREDGAMTVTNEEDEIFEIDPETINIDGQIFTFIDSENRTWVWNGNSLVHSYFEDELAKMTPEQKLKASPEIEGLVKSNVSTVPDKDYLVLYRDEEGNAIKVFNLLTAQELSLPEAGIIEFNLTDGGKLEMLSFDNAEDLVRHIINSGTVWFKSDERTSYMSTFYRYPPTPEDQAFYDLYNGSGLSTANAGGLTLPQNTDSPKIFGVFLSAFNINGTRITFKDIAENLHAVYSDLDKQSLIYALRALPESIFEISN